MSGCHQGDRRNLQFKYAHQRLDTWPPGLTDPPHPPEPQRGPTTQVASQPLIWQMRSTLYRLQSDAQTERTPALVVAIVGANQRTVSVCPTGQRPSAQLMGIASVLESIKRSPDEVHRDSRTSSVANVHHNRNLILLSDKRLFSGELSPTTEIHTFLPDGKRTSAYLEHCSIQTAWQDG